MPEDDFNKLAMTNDLIPVMSGKPATVGGTAGRKPSSG